MRRVAGTVVDNNEVSFFELYEFFLFSQHNNVSHRDTVCPSRPPYCGITVRLYFILCRIHGPRSTVRGSHFYVIFLSNRLIDD